MNAVINAFLTGSVPLVTMKCPVCGIDYAVSEALYDTKRIDHSTWYCPNGHSLHFPAGETWQTKQLREAQAEAERAKREAAQQREMREWAEKRARGANIQVGKARAAHRRLLHRVECGVCPHCQRTFKQLAAHMKSKHPKVGGMTPSGGTSRC